MRRRISFGGFVGERGAQDVARHDSQVVDQVGEPFRERAGFPRARSRDNAHEPLGRRDRLHLRGVELGASDTLGCEPLASSAERFDG